ncbi:hypothetical protein [Kocuria nitroreducens]|uniref:hypothetical protein n=1 Tax=Kocuria nitroreducens TaxID=3058914 RepID=UPI0036DF583E
MNTRLGDVVAGSGVVLMVVTLIGMVIDLWAEVAPGASVAMLFALGAVGVAGEAVRRYEHGAAHQQSTGEALLEMRRRRAELTQREQAENTSPPGLLAA